MRNVPQNTTNEMLLSQLAQGSEEAFMRIYEQYWQKVFSVAYNRLHNIQEAEDIVHDVFTSLWANRATSQIVLLENYLATATKYMVLNRIREAKKHPVYLRAVQDEALAPFIEDALHYRQILAIVHQAVEQLPERCRLVFQYSRDEGMSVKQIAKVMHISPKTVENQLTKALRQLRVSIRSFLPFLSALLIGLCSLFAGR